MRTFVGAACLLAAAWLSAARPAGAGEAGGDDGRLDRRISVEMKAVSFAKCLELLREKSGVNVIAGQNVVREMGEAPVTFALKDVPVWTVMHLFARSCGLEVSHEQGVFVFEKPVKPDDVWARLKLDLGDGEIEVRVLRCDVGAGLRRGLVARLIEEQFEDDAEGQEEDRDEDNPRPPERPGAEQRGEKPGGRPAPREDAPRKPREGELF